MTICKHGIDRNNACSLCAGNVPQMGNSGQSPLMGASTTICEVGPLPAFKHSSGTYSGNAQAQTGERIYEYTVRTVEGKLYAVTLLLTPQHLAQLQRESIVPQDVREIVSRQYIADAVVAMIEKDGETVQ